MSSKRIAISTLVAVVAGTLATAAPGKDAGKAKLGVQTPGVQIPFTSLKSEAEIDGKAAPSGVAFTTEIFTAAGDSILRIDAKTNKPGDPITGIQGTCASLLSAFSSLWTAGCDGRVLAKIDPKTGKVITFGEIGELSAQPAIAASGDSIWILADGKTNLLRVDPKENRIVAEIRLPADCTSVLAAESSLWVTCPGAGRLLRIEPRTNLVDKRVEVDGEPFASVSGEGSVWVYAKKAGKVVQVDPKTNKVTATIDLGTPNIPASMAFGGGSVWLSSPGFPITRIHAGAVKVVQQFTGAGGGLVYFGLGSLWLADPSTNKITRFDPKRIAATLAD